MKPLVCSLAGLLLMLTASRGAAFPLPPTTIDSFGSRADLTIHLLPAWTGEPEPISVPLTLNGPTVIERDLVATGSPDTIDTEILSMDLTGISPSPLSFPVSLRAGLGNGFFLGLPGSPGQIQESSPPANGVIDVFPVDSFFDVFFDIWVDLDFENDLDLGEVLRSEHALRMQKSDLGSLPPEVGDQYVSVGWVDRADPFLGTFAATVFTGPLFLLPIDQNGNPIGPAHAVIESEGGHTHTVIPEPSSLLILLGGVVCMMGVVRRRRSK